MRAVPKTTKDKGKLREIFEEDIGSPVTITLSTVREKGEKLVDILLTVMQIHDNLRHIQTRLKKLKTDQGKSTMYTGKPNNDCSAEKQQQQRIETSHDITSNEKISQSAPKDVSPCYEDIQLNDDNVDVIPPSDDKTTSAYQGPISYSQNEESLLREYFKHLISVPNSLIRCAEVESILNKEELANIKKYYQVKNILIKVISLKRKYWECY